MIATVLHGMPYYLMALAGVLLTALSQLLLKLGARSGRRLIHAYANPLTLTAYALFVVVTLLNLYAYRYLPMKVAVTLLPLTIILVTVLSRLFLREKLSRASLFSGALILVGMVIYHL